MFGGDLLGDAVSPNPSNQLGQLQDGNNNNLGTNIGNNIGTTNNAMTTTSTTRENVHPELIRLDRDFEKKQRISDETVVRNLELMGEEHNACWGVIKNLTQQIRTCGGEVEVKNE
jgi:hypothetical protein